MGALKTIRWTTVLDCVSAQWSRKKAEHACCAPAVCCCCFFHMQEAHLQHRRNLAVQVNWSIRHRLLLDRCYGCLSCGGGAQAWKPDGALLGKSTLLQGSHVGRVDTETASPWIRCRGRANARIHLHFCPILWAWLTEILFATRLTSPTESACQTKFLFCFDIHLREIEQSCTLRIRSKRGLAESVPVVIPTFRAHIRIIVTHVAIILARPRRFTFVRYLLLFCNSLANERLHGFASPSIRCRGSALLKTSQGPPVGALCRPPPLTQTISRHQGIGEPVGLLDHLGYCRVDEHHFFRCQCLGV